MKIISIQQPWAYLIVTGTKDIENRTWRTNYRGPVLVHASARADRDITPREVKTYYGVTLPPPHELDLGGVVGITEIVDCVDKWFVGTWFNGPFGFVLKNSRPLPFVPWKGQLGIRDAPPALLRKLNL